MREVEAITEDDGDDKSCFCCEPGHAPGTVVMEKMGRQAGIYT